MSTRARALPLVFLLCVAGAGRAAFERDLFPAFPGAAPGLTLNPADLATLTGGCGQIGHDRPFGLRPLAGHALMLSAPVGRPRLGVGLAQRGPERYRERSAWLAAGAAPAPGLAVGAGGQVFAAGGSGRTALAPLIGAELARGSWRAAGWFRRATWLTPGRGGVRLERAGRDGRAFAGLDLRRGRAARLELGVVAHLGAAVSVHLGTSARPRQFELGVAVRRERLFASAAVRSHPQLGATPSWTAGRPCR